MIVVSVNSLEWSAASRENNDCRASWEYIVKRISHLLAIRAAAGQLVVFVYS